MAEGKKKEQEKQQEAKQYSMDEVNTMIAQAVAEASRQAAQEAVEAYKASQPQTILQVAQDEYVTIMYIGANASGTTVSMPKWGQITYAGGMIDIPKKEFMQGLGVPVNNALLRERKIIVVSGLTDAEKKRFGVEYKDGELLTTEAFFSLIGYDIPKITEIYKKLCDEHKRTVAKLFFEAYFEKGDNRVTRDKVKALNEISKAVDKDGLFSPIIEDMNEKDK